MGTCTLGLIFLFARPKKLKPKPNPQLAPPPDQLVFDDRTRVKSVNRISSLAQKISSIKTDFSEVKAEKPPPEPPLETLNLKPFSENLITEPLIDQTDAGQFSKMSIDASLLFEEEVPEKKQK